MGSVLGFLFLRVSLLLCVFFGAALGNVVRGVPLDASGYFFEPLWTNFQLGERIGILDWYTILVGLLALAALVVHGALWVVLKTTGPVRDRSLRIARLNWWLVVALTIAVTIASLRVQPAIARHFRSAPWGYLFPLIALAGLVGVRWSTARRRMEELSRCRMLFDGNAPKRSVWNFPDGAPRP
jgi:cytochrome d ubiquinol oxidase subunit II